MENQDIPQVKEPEKEVETVVEEQETNEVTEEIKAESQQDPVVEEKETDEQINWKKWRDKRKEDRKLDAEKDQRLRDKEDEVSALKEAIQNINAIPQSELTQKEKESIVAELSDEDIPTGKEVKDLLETFVPRAVEKILGKRDEARRVDESERKKKETPIRLKEAHEDFEEVVTEHNIDYLTYHHPAIADALNSVPDAFKRWNGVYEMIKKLVPVGNKRDAKRMEANATKPQNIAAARAQPSSEKGYGRSMTQAEKEANYAKLRSLASGI